MHCMIPHVMDHGPPSDYPYILDNIKNFIRHSMVDTGLLFGGGLLVRPGRHMNRMCTNMHMSRAPSMTIIAFRGCQLGRQRTLPNF